MARRPPTAARQVAAVFAASGGLAVVVAALGAHGHRDAMGVGVTSLLLAGAVWVLPWHRWGGQATIALMLPTSGLLCEWNAAGLLPPRSLAPLFLLSFVWLGVHHRPWASVAVLPFSVGIYILSALAHEDGAGVDPRAVAVFAVVCVLLAEAVSRNSARLRLSEVKLRASEVLG